MRQNLLYKVRLAHVTGRFFRRRFDMSEKCYENFQTIEYLPPWLGISICLFIAMLWFFLFKVTK